MPGVLSELILWLAAVLAVGASWVASGWYLWSEARSGKPRIHALWKLLATAFALALGAAARTIYQELRADPLQVWESAAMVRLALLLLALLVPFAIAVVNLGQGD